MKRIFPFCTLLILLMLCTGCLKNSFEVSLTLPKTVTGNYTLLFYASDSKKGWITETAVILQDGKWQSTLATHNPTVVWISGQTQHDMVAFYVERGDNIKIEGKSANPLEWTIGGNKMNEEWTAWRQANLSVLQSHDGERINAAVAKYIKANTDKPLAMALLLTTYDRSIDEKGYSTLWNSLGKKAKDTDLLAAIGRVDQLSTTKVSEMPLPSELNLHTWADSMHVFKLKGSTPTLIFVSLNNDMKRNEAIDSLKGLHRKYSDDSRLNIINIGIARDTLSWKNGVRHDSVPLTSQRWHNVFVAGEVNARPISALDVKHTPWFIVTDAKGRPQYRGDRPADAMKAMRKLLKTTPKQKPDTTKSTK